MVTFELPGFVSEEGELMCDRPSLLVELEKNGLSIVDLMESGVMYEIKWGETSAIRFEFPKED